MANALPVPASNPAPQPKPRRWSIIAAGFLLLALAFVVLYTSRTAFSSPLAMVVVGAIALAVSAKRKPTVIDRSEKSPPITEKDAIRA